MTTPGETHQTAEKWTPTLDTFGARLAAIRQKLGWNVKEAAIACGLPPENWRRWEQENIEPRRLITIAMAIANRTGCDLDWLVYGPEQATRKYLSEPMRRKDPLAARVLPRDGEVRHGDGRKTPRRNGRPARSAPTSTPRSRPMSRTAAA